MHKKKQTIIILILILCPLCFVNGLLFFRLLKENSHLKSDINTQNIKIKHYQYNDIVNTQLTSTLINIDSTTIIETLYSEKILFREIVNEYLVVFRYSNISCGSCVDSEVLLLRQLVNQVGLENVLIVTDNEDTGQIFRYKRMHKIIDVNTVISNDDNLNIFTHEYSIPYYFIIDSNLLIRSVYIPHSELNELTIQWYNKIENIFFPK